MRSTLRWILKFLLLASWLDVCFCAREEIFRDNAVQRLRSELQLDELLGIGFNSTGQQHSHTSDDLHIDPSVPIVGASGPRKADASVVSQDDDVRGDTKEVEDGTAKENVKEHSHGGLGGTITLDTLGDAQPMEEKANKRRHDWIQSLLLLADWSNVLAGVFLMVAFLAQALTFSAGLVSHDSSAWLIKFTSVAAGVFYTIAGASMSTISAYLGNLVGCASQAVIMLGGMFFVWSSFGSPMFMIGVQCVFAPLEFCHACAHYGISCFMMGTAIGFFDVLPLDKGELVSPFWGVAFFFIGAWLIGLVHLWIPTLAGNKSFDGVKPDDYLAVLKASPSFTWTWKLWFALLGSQFLTAGAVIFGMLDEIFGV